KKKVEYETVRVGKTDIVLSKEDARDLKALTIEANREKEAAWQSLDKEYTHKDENGVWYFRIPKSYHDKIKEKDKRRRKPPVFKEKDLAEFEEELELIDTINSERTNINE
ncbi:MAG: hypothetical protein QMD92_02115, partial [bacterium]|nr:hypothetical protein [bacterium]